VSLAHRVFSICYITTSKFSERATSEYAIAAERWRFCVCADGRIAPQPRTAVTPCSFGSSDQHLCRDAEAFVQAADRCDRQPAFSAENLRNPGARTDDFFQISARESLLLHAELDRLNGIGRVHWMVLRLIRINQRRQYIQAIAVWRSGLRTLKALDLF
jgi:hypothetical protein